jgi:hypothetical protein
MLIQFSYVVFLSLAFPRRRFSRCSTTFWSCLRTDAFKLCHVRHSPLAHNTSDISVWLSELLVMSVMAVLTN